MADMKNSAPSGSDNCDAFSSLTPAQAEEMAQSLLAWHQPMLREMPWRETRDPYRIWVAEVMLHQTQARTVVPYFERFVRTFPTVQALSDASLDDVLKLWAGLGYYARARNLHAAARLIVEKHGGAIPPAKRDLLALPGIGPYTAGAILSIAYGQDEPVVDGNIIRVLCRAFDVTEDPSRPLVRRFLWQLAGDLLPRGRAGDFNQALMDLGASICTPRSPQCGSCPWRGFCRAYRQGNQDERPLRPARRLKPHYDIAVGVIEKDGCVLIARRPAKGLLGGLWEFPGGKIEAGETAEQALSREVWEELGIEVTAANPFMVVEHAYTHFKVTLHVMRCRYRAGTPQCRACDDWRWEQTDKLGHYAFPAANQRIIAALQADRGAIGTNQTEQSPPPS